jgi:hypothetical protein
MTHTPAAVASVLLLAGSLLAVADPPAADPPAAARLVEKLGDADFHAREAATQRLEELGPAALDALRAACRSDDPEVARRAGELVGRIERRAANERVLAPTVVELAAADARLDAVLADLSKQSGYGLGLGGPKGGELAAKKVTLKTGKVPFWEAVRAVCDAADLQVASVGGFVAPGGSGSVSVAPSPLPLGQAMPGGFGQPLLGMPQPAPVPLFRAIPAPPAVPLPAPLAPVPPKPAKDGPGAMAPPGKGGLAATLARARAEQVKAALAAERQAAIVRLAQLQAAVPQQAQPPVLIPNGLGPIGPVFESGRPAMPSAAGTGVVLEARTGPKRPAAVYGAVLVEAFAVPTAAAAPDSLAALLQVWPEPRLNWEQARGVKVTRAADDGGRPLAADTTPAEPPLLYADRRAQMVRRLGGGGVVVFNADGAVLAPALPGFTPNARQVVVKLKPGERLPAALREFAGSVFGTVRSGPEVLATAELGDGNAAAATTVAGVGLRASLHQPEDGPAAVTVDLTYEPGSVNPVNPGNALAGRSGLRDGPRTKEERAAAFNHTVYGLRVTDADGKPFTASPVTVTTSRTDPTGRHMSMNLRLSLTPTEKGQGDPKAIAFWGTYHKPVEVPFTLKDVPLVGGAK